MIKRPEAGNGSETKHQISQSLTTFYVKSVSYNDFSGVEKKYQF